MQERFLGDAHDFVKFALLRHMQRQLHFRVGLNWYLNAPESNGHGEQRHHLHAPLWGTWDASLLDELHCYQDPNLRRIDTVPDSGILPDGSPVFAEPVPAQGREAWHRRATQALKDANLVFLDPDNGLLPPSGVAARARKYAFYEEVADYLRSGKIVCCIQFARQCDPITRAREIQQRLAAACVNGRVLPILRARVTPNILIATVCPPEWSERVTEALASFAENSPARPGQAKGRIVELISQDPVDPEVCSPVQASCTRHSGGFGGMKFPDRYQKWCDHDLDGFASPLYKGLRPEDRPKVWRFIEEQYLEKYQRILTVNFDWGAWGLWQPLFPGSLDMGLAIPPEQFGLPPEIAASLLAWQEYGDQHMEPWNPKNVFDHDMWSAWGLQVAKRVAVAVPRNIYLEYHPFRQLVVGERGEIVELEVPAFIRELTGQQP